MKTFRVIWILLILMFIRLTLHAQDKFGSYICPQDEKKYDISISMTGGGIFTLWINAKTDDTQYKLGGIILRERDYYRFLDDMERAKMEFADLIKKDKEGLLSKNKTALRITSDVDGYFYASSWNLKYELALNYNFIKSNNADGTPHYSLVASTGKFRSMSNPSFITLGYQLIFNSPEEIDQFLKEISIDKINEYAERVYKHGFTVKDKLLHENSSVAGKQASVTLDYGFIGQCDASFGIYHYDYTDTNVPYPYYLITDKISHLAHLNGGVFLRLNYRSLFLQPEFLYAFGQNKYVMTFYEKHHQKVDMNLTATMNSFDFPLMFGFKFWENKNRNLHVLAGPDVRFNLNSTAEKNYFFTYSTTQPDAVTFDFRPVMVGFQAGLGYDFWRFSFGIRYKFEKNYFQTKLIDTVIDDYINLHAIRFSVGVKL